MTSSFLVAAKRTPIGKMLGALSTVPAPQLAAAAIRGVLTSCALDPLRVEEAILGNVLQAGVGQAPARQAALAAGCSSAIGALTVNKVCGSGLKAVMLADQAIRSGDASLVVAGGMENMSRAPHLAMGTRAGWKYGPQTLLDCLVHDGLWCAISNQGMGSLSDYIAAQHHVSRSDQDAFSAESHVRALAAQAAGKFQTEIVPVVVPAGKGETSVTQDEGPRQTSPADLARLRPAFAADGTATAGNASQISDGAAAVVVVNAALAGEFDSPLKARIVASATHGVAPQDLFIAPVGAIEKALAKAGLRTDAIDLFELNEAFASQSLACLRALKLPPEKVNVHGGAIALGHPIGASGARILVTLLHALADRGLRRGLAALCLGGGEAVAMIVERVEST